MEERFFDTVHRVESPEGIVLDLHPAGPYIRFLAWLVDTALRFGLLIFLSVIVASSGVSGMGLFYIGYFCVAWFYPVFFELFANGATPGKRLFDLQVVKLNGTPVDLGASLIRNILRVVDTLPFFPIGLVSMVTTRCFRRLGDLAAGTIVVYRRDAAVSSVWRTASAERHHPVLPSISLDLAEQRSLVSFTSRAAFFGESRARELASIIVPYVDPRSDASADPVGSLSGLAAWITGEQR